jgi:hypothetical protein
MPKFISKPNGMMKLLGPSQTPLKYSSVPTRYASLHGFQNGAEFNPEPIPLQTMPGEIPDNWNRMNIRSGCNVTDIPSRFGLVNEGLHNIGGLTFTAENNIKGWIRNKGEA